MRGYIKDLAKSTRATIYLEPEVHKALRLKAAINEQSISYLVNEVVKQSLEEDREDLRLIKERLKEPDIPYEKALKMLKKRGKL